jgi:hypothetical protein
MITYFLILNSHDVKSVDDPILVIVLESENNVTRSELS